VKLYKIFDVFVFVDDKLSKKPFIFTNNKDYKSYYMYKGIIMDDCVEAVKILDLISNKIIYINKNSTISFLDNYTKGKILSIKKLDTLIKINKDIINKNKCYI